MEEDLEKLGNFFSALSSGMRLKIIHILLSTDKPVHVKGIAKMLKSDYAVTYRHIEKLKQAGILGIYEVGRSRVPYVINKGKVLNLVSIAKECMTEKT